MLPACTFLEPSTKRVKKPKRPPPNWELFPELPRQQWASEKPSGLYVLPESISQTTHDSLLSFFEEKVVWVQRFGKQYPKTAHYNYFRTYIDADDPSEIDAELKKKYPELYAASHECFSNMKKIIPEGCHTAFDSFHPETFSVHKHCPNWGLGAHYDNTHDPGDGLVLMLNVVREGEQVPAIHREFCFTDPPSSRKYSVFTPAKLGVVFTGNAYDFWQHESIRNKKQTDTCYSITIRLKKVCGHGKKVGETTYKPGAGPAKEVAHKRISAKRARGENY